MQNVQPDRTTGKQSSILLEHTDASNTCAMPNRSITLPVPFLLSGRRGLVLAFLFITVTLGLVLSLLLLFHLSILSVLLIVVLFALIGSMLLLMSLALSYTHTLIHPKKSTFLTEFPMPVEKIQFSSSTNDHQVHGIFIQRPGASTAIIVCASHHVSPIVTSLWEAGHYVLVFESSGHVSGTPDFLGAVAYARRRMPFAAFGAYGLSFGGAVCILGSARTPEIKAVVADSAFATYFEAILVALHQTLRRWPRLIIRFLCGMVDLLLQLRAGRPLEPLQEVKQLAQPLLLIHALTSTNACPHDAQLLYQAASKPKALWLVPSAEHTLSSPAYIARVTAFFERHLKSEATEEAQRQVLPDPILSLQEHSNSSSTHQSIVQEKRAEPEQESDEQARIQQSLIGIFAQILRLQRSQVEMSSDFFLLGGDADTLPPLLSAIEQHFQVRLEASDIFDHPILSRLAARISRETHFGTGLQRKLVVTPLINWLLSILGTLLSKVSSSSHDSNRQEPGFSSVEAMSPAGQHVNKQEQSTRTQLQEQIKEAQAYLRLFGEENNIVRQIIDLRISETTSSIRQTGTYQHTYEELEFGAKVAWRNSTRCTGRLHWRNLDVRDMRHLTTAESIFEALVEHIQLATNGGKIRSSISIFAPQAPGQPGIRIWNPQLIRYAGYEVENGKVIGDPAHVELTNTLVQLGWKGGKGTPFDPLPLVIQMPYAQPKVFELPPEIILEVPIEHPDYPWFADLGLKWHALPVVSNMRLEIGGISYTAAPFNGWYLGTEIGARNLADQHRYNMLPIIAEKLGINTRQDRALWKDKALVELNVAVLSSFSKAGVTMVDHHTVARQLVVHEEKEKQAGRCMYANWSWVVPPMSGATTPVFHRHFKNKVVRPNFFYQPDPWKEPKKTD